MGDSVSDRVLLLLFVIALGLLTAHELDKKFGDPPSIKLELPEEE